MESTPTIEKVLSWKDCLLGIGLRVEERATTTDIFHNKEDFALSKTDVVRSPINGIPSINFSERYLTVQPWTTNFNIAQLYPSMVMAWIRFPSLLGHMYKRQILWEIGGLVGKVVKLDYNTNNGVRGRFARMVVYVNLDK
ncbi:hypothetical protein Golax_025891, partial [Gossypium laxum]|nr:hypothetical protein [Gossypium laxum]